MCVEAHVAAARPALYTARVPQPRGGTGPGQRAWPRRAFSPAVLALALGCAPQPVLPPRPAPPSSPAPAALVAAPAEPPEPLGAMGGHVQPTCGGTVAVFEAGREVGSLCPAEARRAGLALVDLSDDWVP